MKTCTLFPVSTCALSLAFLLSGCSGAGSGSSADNAPATTSPQSSVQSIHLVGTAPATPGANITVDGKPARILADGSWDIDLPLPATTKAVTVRFTAPGTAAQEKSLLIKR